ncbi:sulfite oxidase [Roseococcus sp. SDR]|uniref:sulfite oxidase n=1 Tax=Roseococcus sp. SDR TaxID=2835532 RepID=UPI001BCE948C|nr:sulfite oxidase [Roseococcus sp. SDR]MBS7790821.1 sulfite oxidase [Roseococcus sp. SDR]MBV1846135.1 sulfite oxidase [Roseococcus sp. SDR]
MLRQDTLGTPKPGLTSLADPALNQETPPHLLTTPITPTELFFVRNNGTLPEVSPQAAADWTLEVTGCVRRPLSLRLDELRGRFPTVEVTAVLECAGNGRSAFEPPVPGLAWGPGAVGCARWTGVRLADVLAEAGVTAEAVYVAHESPDHAIGAPGQPALSRGLPLAKALAPETLLAFGMNGAPLDPLHGFPLRVVAPGYPGSAWQKWLSRIVVRDREHDGAKMTGLDYRMPRRPIRPGEAPDPSLFDVITDMPVKSLITEPAPGFCTSGPVMVGGFAWSGASEVERVEVSADGGATWQRATLEPGEGPWAWHRFKALMLLPAAGEVELLARATDAAGNAQPMQPVWNPRGYLNNAVHRIRGRMV